MQHAWIAIALVAGCISTSSLAAADIEIESVIINLIAEAEVPAEEAGLLREVVAQEGDRVKAGDLLARINDRDAALDVAKAKIVLAQASDLVANDVKQRRAQQTLKLARLELARSEEANKQLERVVSASQIEKLKIDVENALLDVEQADKDLATARRGVEVAQNELAIAERALERRRVTTPIDGIVVEIHRNQGEWLRPGEAVMRVVRDDRLRAEGFVHVDRLTFNPLGCAATIQWKLPSGESMTRVGKVVFVSPEANPINGQTRIWAEVDNSDGRLRAGTAASMVVQNGASAAAVQQ